MTTQLLLSEISAEKTIRQLKLTDYNQKKNCHCMLEINFAPKAGISETQLRETEFEITWEDESIGMYKLYDIIRLELFEMRSCFTWPSHGMTAFDFTTYFIQKNPQLFSLEEKTPINMAVYFYRKI